MGLELKHEETPLEDLVKAAANALADATDSDVLVYSGDIDRPYDDKLLDRILAFPLRRKNVILILATFVRDASDQEQALLKLVKGASRNPVRDEPLIGVLSDPRKEATSDADNTEDVGAGSPDAATGSSSAEGSSGEQSSAAAG